MAQAQGAEVSGVASSGIGLAFIAFPTIVSQATGGSIIGVLFLARSSSRGHLVDLDPRGDRRGPPGQLGWSRIRTTLVVSILLALVSMALFSTTTALAVLDTADAFVNASGIMAVALVAVVVVAWLLHRLPELKGSPQPSLELAVGRIWMLLVGVLAPLVLGYLLVSEVIGEGVDAVRRLSGLVSRDLRLGDGVRAGRARRRAVAAAVGRAIARQRGSDYDAFLAEHYDPDPETNATPARSGERRGAEA